MNESDPRSNVHYLGSSENKAWKNSGLYGIWTHDLCDTGAVVMGSNPVQAWIFFRPYFHYCLSSAYHCEDHFHSQKSFYPYVICLKHMGVFELIRIEFIVTTFALKYFRCLGSVLAVRSNITRCYAFAFWVSRRKKFLLELPPSFSNDVMLFDWSSIRHNILTNIE